MAFIKSQWVDRMSEYPNRRTLVKETGGSEVVTVSRNEGLVTSEGTPLDASNMNNLENRIGNMSDKTDASLAPVEPGATALRSYLVGDYLVNDGQLYKVVAAITQGNALVVDGNIQATNVGAEVASLNNDIATPRLAPNDIFTGLVIASNFIFIPADRVYINKRTFTVTYIDIYNVAILTSHVASAGGNMNGIMVEITGYDMSPHIGRYSVARLSPLV